MAILRSFVGISLNILAAPQIGPALEAIKAADQQQSIHWVPVRNWHITLAFLGDQTEEKLATLPEYLATSLFDIVEFEVSLNSIELFPDSSSRIIAARVSSSPALELLHQRVYQAVNSLEMGTTETLAFLPHVTLGRVRKGRSAIISVQPVNAVLKVQKISVFSSQRTPKGSVYTPLSSVSLVRHHE